MADGARRLDGIRDREGWAAVGDYGILGDGRGIALLALDGVIDWWAVPRMDNDPAFAALLDPAHGGRLGVRPTSPDTEATFRYVPDTNVVEISFTTPQGRATATYSLNVGASGPLPWSEFACRIEVTDGEVEFALDVAPGTGLGLWTTWAQSDERGATLHCRTQTLGVVVPTSVQLEVSPTTVTSRFTVHSGHPVTIGILATDEHPLFLASIAKIDTRIDSTVDSWRRWAAMIEWTGPHRQQIVRNALALKLLIMTETGAIAAAATTSLPEKIGGGKNWDYRYCWIRDAVLTVEALADCGLQEEVHAAVAWLLDAIRTSGPELHVMYTLDGGQVDDVRHAPAPGYRHSTPVMIGNDATSQVQLGVFGDLFDTIDDWIDRGHVLDVRSARELADLADRCADEWLREDSGIWELPQTHHYTSSKMNCWRALQAAAHLAQNGHINGPVDRWLATADRIRVFIEENCWSEAKQSYTFYAGSEELDASVLLGAGFGYETGARMSTTIDAIGRELGAGPLVYRYSGVHAEEATFVACAYWRVRALALVGRKDEATRLMSELDAAANPLGLLAEMSTPGEFAATGNVPQALSHLALISAATALQAD